MTQSTGSIFFPLILIRTSCWFLNWVPKAVVCLLYRLSAAESTGLTSVRGFGELKALAEKKLRKVLNPPTLTELGAKPDALPTVQPKLSYYILLLNILIYAAGLTARWFDGSGVAEDYFLSLAKVNSEIEAGQYYRYPRHIHWSLLPPLRGDTQGGSG